MAFFDAYYTLDPRPPCCVPVALWRRTPTPLTSRNAPEIATDADVRVPGTRGYPKSETRLLHW